jgi:citrate lyase subunit beta/citryl-CoA lyase
MPGAPWILRSLLFVPGNRPDMIEKAPRYGADAIILDLEDGVAPDAKGRARQIVAAALDAGFPEGLVVLVRVNDAESGLMEQDLREAFRPGVAGICVPKCDTPEQILVVDAHLRVLEDRYRLSSRRTRLIPIIETARGIVNAAAIARCHERICAVAFGAEDFTADLGGLRTREGGELAYPRAVISVAAHAARVDAVDGIYADFRDADGLRADALVVRRMGYTGKMVIHPAQVAPVHATFSPTPAEVDHAQRVVTAFEEAQARGAGIAVVDGAMVDRPVVRRAQRILRIAAGPHSGPES